MKCLVKNLLGLESLKSDSNDNCTAIPPIVVSLVGSTVFILLMTVLSHMLNI